MCVSFRVGCVTAVGGCWEQTANAVRGTIVRRQLVELEGEQFVRACIDDRYLTDFVKPEVQDSRTQRCVGLLAMAFADLESGGDLPGALPTFLALPETATEGGAESDEVLLSLAERRNAGQLQLRKVFNYGPAGGIAAFRAGLNFLQDNDDANDVLVGAVDCLAMLPEMEKLKSGGHLLKLGARDGVIPGEGAVVMVLSRHKPGESKGFSVGETAFSTASGDRYDEAAGWSETLSQVLANAVESVTGAVNAVYVAYDGSNISSEEWGKASLAIADKMSMPYNLQTPALCFGNLGTPSALASIAMAVRGMTEGYIAGPALVWAISEDGKMGATTLSVIPEE